MPAQSSHPLLRVIGLSGSPGGRQSRSRQLMLHALARLERAGHGVRPIDLAELPPAGLLGRTTDAEVVRAIDAVVQSDVLVVATPIYRATYSGLLKVFFDLLPADALVGTVVIPIATGGGPGHLLAIDQGLRPLLASLGALVVPLGVYGFESQFRDGVPDSALLARVDQAVEQAQVLARASAPTVESEV